jgi:hypothetical protein
MAIAYYGQHFLNHKKPKIEQILSHKTLCCNDFEQKTTVDQTSLFISEHLKLLTKPSRIFYLNK